MRKTLVLLLFTSLVALHTNAQDATEQAAIMKPIEMLFTGMNKADSALVHRAFVDEATMATIAKDKDGKLRMVYENSLDGLLKAMGTPRPEPLSEPIWDVKMNVDGNFATVWAQYALYIGKRFNHCGVDAFNLVKGDDGQWRIFHLADTRRKDNCNVPASVSDKYK